VLGNHARTVVLLAHRLFAAQPGRLPGRSGYKSPRVPTVAMAARRCPHRFRNRLSQIVSRGHYERANGGNATTQFAAPSPTGAAGLEPATPGFGDRCSAS